MKGTISVWIWIAGGVIAGLLIFTIANSYFARTTRTIAEQRSLEQHNELRTQINELCWSSSENKKQYTVNLDENVLGVYLTKDKYTEYNETQFVDFILNENVSSGNLLCMKMKNKRLICSPIDCSTRMTFLGAVPTEFSLSALINNIIGNPDSFEYRLNFSKFGKEVLVSRAGGKEVLPLCNLDNNCTLKECREDCKDCYGPNPICVWDGFCNSDIDENCLNSIDCACNTSEGYACCLNDTASDNSGCVDETRQNLSKGKKCFCDNECNISANLTCNPTSSSFSSYENACCESGKSWNGTDCTNIKPKLKIVFMPVNWNSGWVSFNNSAQQQYDNIINNIPLASCPEKAEGLFLNTNCNVNFLDGCQCADLIDIEKCVILSGEDYDYIIGLEDSDVCGSVLGFSCGFGTVFSESSVTLVSVHELGHEWGLNDEYVDACMCGLGLVDPSANCLNLTLNGDDPVFPYTSNYCGGGSCPTSYTVTCYGNKNPSNGRCIMSFGNAPGPRKFCQECLNHLATVPIINC